MKWLLLYAVLGMFTTGIVAADSVKKGKPIDGDMAVAATVIWPVAWGAIALNATYSPDCEVQP